jgi:hypothetical protein
MLWRLRRMVPGKMLMDQVGWRGAAVCGWWRPLFRQWWRIDARGSYYCWSFELMPVVDLHVSLEWTEVAVPVLVLLWSIGRCYSSCNISATSVFWTLAKRAIVLAWRFQIGKDFCNSFSGFMVWSCAISLRVSICLDLWSSWLNVWHHISGQLTVKRLREIQLYTKQSLGHWVSRKELASLIILYLRYNWCGYARVVFVQVQG